MNKITGFLAGKFGFWGIGIGSGKGTIQMKKKVRSNNKALDAIINDMKESEFKPDTVVVSHCQNSGMAESLKNAIQNIWNDINVIIIPTRGLCSYYAERGGLIVGY